MTKMSICANKKWGKWWLWWPRSRYHPVYQRQTRHSITMASIAVTAQYMCGEVHQVDWGLSESSWARSLVNIHETCIAGQLAKAKAWAEKENVQKKMVLLLGLFIPTTLRLWHRSKPRVEPTGFDECAQAKPERRVLNWLRRLNKHDGPGNAGDRGELR